MKIVAGYFSKNNTAFYDRVEQGEFSKAKFWKWAKTCENPEKKGKKKATEEQYYHDLKNH